MWAICTHFMDIRHQSGARGSQTPVRFYAVCYEPSSPLSASASRIVQSTLQTRIVWFRVAAFSGSFLCQASQFLTANCSTSVGAVAFMAGISVGVFQSTVRSQNAVEAVLAFLQLQIWTVFLVFLQIWGGQQLRRFGFAFVYLPFSSGFLWPRALKSGLGDIR